MDVNGTRLRVRKEGGADGVPVVLIHSLGTNLELWDSQIGALGAERPVIRYDTRGHGGSGAPPLPYAFSDLVDDLLGVIRHYGIGRAHVVGISLGALTALEAALSGAPEIASIAVCDSRADMPPEFARGIDERNALIRENGIAAIADAMVERWLTPATIAGRPDVAGKVREMVLATSVEGFAGCSEAIKTSGLMDRIDAIGLPSLFVAADSDGGLPVEVMRGMQTRVPGSGFACIPAAGHLSNLDQPAVFNAILAAHLRRVD
jgi:3-oxoadipate enol-lactonase